MAMLVDLGGSDGQESTTLDYSRLEMAIFFIIGAILMVLGRIAVFSDKAASSLSELISAIRSKGQSDQ